MLMLFLRVRSRVRLRPCWCIVRCPGPWCSLLVRCTLFPWRGLCGGARGVGARYRGRTRLSGPLGCWSTTLNVCGTALLRGGCATFDWSRPLLRCRSIVLHRCCTVLFSWCSALLRRLHVVTLCGWSAALPAHRSAALSCWRTALFGWVGVLVVDGPLLRGMLLILPDSGRRSADATRIGYSMRRNGFGWLPVVRGVELLFVLGRRLLDLALLRKRASVGFPCGGQLRRHWPRVYAAASTVIADAI